MSDQDLKLKYVENPTGYPVITVHGEKESSVNFSTKLMIFVPTNVSKKECNDLAKLFSIAPDLLKMVKNINLLDLTKKQNDELSELLKFLKA